MGRKGISEDDYFSALKRLKERKEHLSKRIKGHDGEWQYPSIGIGMIAKEMKCNVSTLYKTDNEKIQTDIIKYQKIKKKNNISTEKPGRNTKAYYVDLSKRYRDKIDGLESQLNQVRTSLIEYEKIKSKFSIIQDDNKRLIKEKIDLQNENDRLRVLLLKNGINEK